MNHRAAVMTLLRDERRVRVHLTREIHLHVETESVQCHLPRANAVKQ